MDSLLQSPLQRVTLDVRSGVSRLQLQSTYYVKVFSSHRSRLQHLLGISRYQRELRNLHYFRSLGLRTPDIVAYGEEKCLGVVQRAALVTAEVIDATDLGQLLRSGGLYRDGVRGARIILAQLARAARRMHEDGFYHRDLKPRNILVRYTDDGPALYFLDCPSGHHPPRFMLHRSIVRDLAHLEAGLRGYVRPVDLLYMYKQYRGCGQLSAFDKAVLREALSYYSQRRRTRKRRRREAQRGAGKK